MPIFDIPLSLANKIYLIANVMLVLGAISALLGTIGVFWSGSIRDKYSDERIAFNEAETAKAKLDAAGANERTANVEKHNLELQTILERERAARLKIEQKIKKREITSEQKSKLLALLKDGPKGVIYLRPKSFDPEAEQYSKQIATILREAGFDVREWKEATLSWSLIGSFLLVKNLEKLPPHALFVQNAFRVVDILLLAYDNPSVPEDSIMIGIGERF